MAVRILIRKGTSASWTLANPILAQGEPGYEIDTKRIKYGDGITPWQLLPYFGSGGTISIDWVDIVGKPSEFPPEDHTHIPTQIVADTNNRFVSDVEKTTWNNKLDSNSNIDAGTW